MVFPPTVHPNQREVNQLEAERRAGRGDPRQKSEEELITDLEGNLNRSGISEDIDNQYYIEMMSGVDGDTPGDPAVQTDPTP